MAICLASPSAAQDSVAVVDRGVPPARVWAIVELPFKLLEAPLRLVGGVAGWMASRIDDARVVPAARDVGRGLRQRRVFPSVGGQGPNSGLGPSLRFGRAQDSSHAPWADVRGAITLRRYWVTEARAGVGAVSVYARSEDRPRDAFFGIGNGTRESDWSDYRLWRTTWGGAFTTRAAWLDFRADVAWTRTGTRRGTARDRPDIDSTFVPLERPGFGAVHRSLAFGAAITWSAGPRHSAARRGSFASVQYRWTDSRSAGVADAGLVRISGAVELPFDHQRRSVVAAVSFESLRPASAGTIPFYAFPSLGGSTSLPSFVSDRFRGRDVLLGQFEYRYRVWSDPGDVVWADAVLFTYGGVVAHRLVDELPGARLHQSTGVAVALLTRGTLVARFGLSKGSDGVGMTFTMGTGL